MKNNRSLKYIETEETALWRAELRPHNCALAALQLALPGFDLEAALIEVGDAWILPWKRAYQRIFLRDFRSGGRLYGPFVQQLPKGLRSLLLIDGRPVLELDYPHLHPTLLYAMWGCALDGDAYDLPHSAFDRSLVKAAWLRMVNAKSRKAAIISLRKDNPGLSQIAAETLFEALEQRHAPIKSAFYKCPALVLQYIDSELMLAVMNTCLAENIVGISVHDSVIVPESDAPRTREIMAEMLASVLQELKSPGSQTPGVPPWPRGPLPSLRQFQEGRDQ